MKNRKAILATATALMQQSTEIIDSLEKIKEKRSLTKREEEILKQEIENTFTLARMSLLA